MNCLSRRVTVDVGCRSYLLMWVVKAHPSWCSRLREGTGLIFYWWLSASSKLSSFGGLTVNLAQFCTCSLPDMLARSNTTSGSCFKCSEHSENLRACKEDSPSMQGLQSSSHLPRFDGFPRTLDCTHGFGVQCSCRESAGWFSLKYRYACPRGVGRAFGKSSLKPDGDVLELSFAELPPFSQCLVSIWKVA